MSSIPPDAVYRACLSGKSQYIRHKAGGTKAALDFAELVVNGFPIPPEVLVEVAEAHHALARAVVSHGEEPVAHRVSRLLWGGDTAAEWAETELSRTRPHSPTPAPIPVAASAPVEAAAGDVWDDLADRVDQADIELVARLETAFWVAYRSALRKATAAAGRVNQRVPLEAQTDLPDQAVNDARQRWAEAGPYDGWQAVGQPVLAAIDVNLERAVRAALDEWEATATTIFLTAAAAGAVAATETANVGETPEDPALTGRVREAVAALSAGLYGWVQARLQGTRDPENLDELAVPPELFTEPVRTAAGVGVNADGDPTLDTQQLSGGVAAAAAHRVLRAVGLRVVTETEWVYGRRHRDDPFPEHQRLNRVRWSNPQERAVRVGRWFPGDHKGCRCRLKTRWRIQR